MATAGTPAAAAEAAKASSDVPDAVMHQGEGIASTTDIATLMKDHKAEINQLKRLVADVTPASGEDSVGFKFDDLFFLRYILSFGSAAAAEPMVRKCYEHRFAPANVAMFKVARNPDASWKEMDIIKEFRKYQVSGAMAAGNREQAVVVVRMGMSDSAGLYQNMTTDEVHYIHMLYREISYWEIDAITRKTGQLTKQSLLCDMTDSRLSDMMDKKMSTLHQKVSGVCAYLYPQLQDKMVLVNAPSWMAVIMNLFRKVMPKRNTEKVEIFSSTKDMWASEWAKRALAREKVPAFLGGGVADEDLLPELTGVHLVRGAEDTHVTKVTVANRSSVDVQVDVPIPGTTVKYSVGVEAYGIAMGAVLHRGEGEGLELCRKATGVDLVLRAPASDKIKADAGLCKGVIKCPHAGVLTITFDNSYSILRSKTLSYRFDVELPEGAAAAAAEGGAEAPAGAAAGAKGTEAGVAVAAGAGSAGSAPATTAGASATAGASETTTAAAAAAPPASEVASAAGAAAKPSDVDVSVA